MRISKVDAPFCLLVSIVDKGEGLEIEKYLESVGCGVGLMLYAKGTAESNMADIFGFGMSDKDIVTTLIPVTKKDKIMREVNRISGVEKDKYGLNLILDLQSASSNLIELVRGE